MEKKLTIKYADNGIVVHETDSDSMRVYETSDLEGKQNAMMKLGAAIWYGAIEDRPNEIENEISEFCNKHRCLCDGVAVTLKIEPTYHPVENKFITDDKEKNKRVLLVSRIKTPDGTVLTSAFTHDYQEHIDENGDLYFVDGGNSYQRTSVNRIPFEDVSIYTDSPFEEIRSNYKRGTFGKDGRRIWKPICECSDKHLENILIYNKEHCPNAPEWYSDIIKKEQEYRKEHGITIEDNKPIQK